MMGSARVLNVASFNLCNLLAPTSRHGLAETLEQAYLTTHLVKLRRVIHEVLDLPDIIAVQEVGDEVLLERLASAINEAAGTAYAALAPPVSDLRGIRVGLLWDRRRTTLYAARQLSGPAVEAAFGPTSPSPGREPLVGTFDFGSRRLTIIVNHFKSNYVPDHDLPHAEDRRLVNQRQRLAQAAAVRAYASDLLKGDRGAWLLVAGDMNGGYGIDGPLPVLLGDQGETQLTDLWELAQESQPYTYVGQAGPVVLDYILASRSLREQALSFRVHHINAAADPTLATDPETLSRASDHDPIQARFGLKTAA